MIFILAGSYQQAQEEARTRELRPNEWTYVARPDRLRGLRNGGHSVIYGYGFRGRPDAGEMLDIVWSQQLPEYERRTAFTEDEYRVWLTQKMDALAREMTEMARDQYGLPEDVHFEWSETKDKDAE